MELPRATVFLLLLLGLLGGVAGGVTAQSQQDADAEVRPPVASPGQDLELIFHISSPELAEAAVQPEVGCTVTFPSGQERQPCQRGGPVLEVQAVGSSTREYVFDYQAPAGEGVYRVDFQTDSLLRAPQGPYTAQASFEVRLPAPGAGTDGGTGGSQTGPPDGDGTPGGEGPPGPDGSDGQPGADDGPGHDEQIPLNEFSLLSGNRDEARLFVSSTVSLAVITAGLVARRWTLAGGG